MLPIPFEQYAPPYEGIAPLARKVDKIYGEILDEIINLKRLYEPFEAESFALNAFGESVDARIEYIDGEYTKRKKIKNAIENNRLLGTWTQVKNACDAICGGDAQMVANIPVDMWLLCGDGGAADAYASPEWAVFGASETINPGISLEGVPTLWQKGTFYIDVGNDHLTELEIQRLKEALLISLPVGMIIVVGYLVGTEVMPYFTIGRPNEEDY